ncbi:MAG: phage holin family protein [Sporolactobacillus sp.]
MNRYEGLYKGIAAGVGAGIGYFFGEWYPLLEFLLVFVIIDYVSGWLVAAYSGKLSSKVGFNGIAKKIMLFFMIAVAHLSDRMLGSSHVVMNAAVYFYMANELLSIVENAGRLGLPVPPKIKQMIELLRDKNG